MSRMDIAPMKRYFEANLVLLSKDPKRVVEANEQRGFLELVQGLANLEYRLSQVEQGLDHVASAQRGLAAQIDDLEG